MKPMLCMLRNAAFLLGVASIPGASVAAPTATGSAAILVAPAMLAIEPAAIGDPPRRRMRRSAAKDKPYQPLSKDPQGESAAAHKDYLKRYGF